MNVSGILDRPPSRTMTTEDVVEFEFQTAAHTASRSRGLMRPSFARNFLTLLNRGRREYRVHAAPAVSCANVHKKKRTRAYRFSGGICLLYTSPSPRDGLLSRMPSS